jgi:LysR family hydrogen peroxide-inducible transcriptional activator
VIRELANEGKDQLSSPLRIGAIYTIGPYLFPHLIPELARSAPQMSLYIEENFTAELRRKLRSGELDAIIIALPFTEADVVTRALYDEPFEVLLPSGHPWTSRTFSPSACCYWAKATVSATRFSRPARRSARTSTARPIP